MISFEIFPLVPGGLTKCILELVVCNLMSGLDQLVIISFTEKFAKISPYLIFTFTTM